MIVAERLDLPGYYELVLFLEPRTVSGGYNWCYYFVDHATRSLFWIQDCDPVDSLDITEVTALNAPYDISAFVTAFRLPSADLMQNTRLNLSTGAYHQYERRLRV